MLLSRVQAHIGPAAPSCQQQGLRWLRVGCWGHCWHCCTTEDFVNACSMSLPCLWHENLSGQAGEMCSLAVHLQGRSTGAASSR